MVRGGFIPNFWRTKSSSCVLQPASVFAFGCLRRNCAQRRFAAKESLRLAAAVMVRFGSFPGLG